MRQEEREEEKQKKREEKEKKSHTISGVKYLGYWHISYKLKLINHEYLAIKVFNVWHLFGFPPLKKLKSQYFHM